MSEKYVIVLQAMFTHKKFSVARQPARVTLNLSSWLASTRPVSFETPVEL